MRGGHSHRCSVLEEEFVVVVGGDDVDVTDDVILFICCSFSFLLFGSLRVLFVLFEACYQITRREHDSLVVMEKIR